MISLTFDDGLPCHYKTVIPEMNQRGMKGTFFVPIIPQDGRPGSDVIFDVRFRDDEWKSAIKDGHEIGGHSLRHRTVKETPTGEIPMSQIMLRDVLGVEPRSYAWPFCVSDLVHRQVASRYYDQARGGPEGRGRFDHPSIVVGDWNIEDLISSAPVPPLVYMFHGVGQPGSWGNISLDQFKRFLDKIEHSVTPYGDTYLLTFAEYMRGRP